ncbi:MAG: TetR/AcrR family transcriptional regulator [Bacilli bacterium]|nr:TetR/AcrR family transcriptional regulator [Bacilli bacterium]MDD4388519.1 TetR/AcrR family transcriptional regulator [Bacilli bacterium]
MDRRVRKTRRILKNALVELMGDKDFRKITVTELAKKADINRGTFYLHYYDIYDLVEEMENECLEHIKKIVKKYSNPVDYYKILINIIEYVKSEKRFFQSIFGKNGDISYINKLKEEMKKLFIQTNKAIPQKDESFQNAFASFIVSGGIGVFQEWLDQDCTPPIHNLILQFYETFIKISL